jgi:Beta-propeller repeat
VTKLNTGATQLVYSTFLGGSGNEGCLGISLVPSCTSNCNAYVTGFTSFSDLATTSGAAQPASGGIRNGLIAELNANGTEFLYTSYLGGYFEDALGIAVDKNANAYVAGKTSSSDFPTVDPIQSAAAPNGILYASTNGFATFTPSGLPASDGAVHDLAVDSSGAIYADTTHNGLFKSTNRHTSFSITAISTGFVSALAFDQSSGTPYAGVEGGLVKSTDGGATFTANALPTSVRVISIEVIPCGDCESGQSTILAGTVGQGIFASFDGGATFGATPAIPGTSVVSLAYDRNDLSIVYAGTDEGLFQNTDVGATFNSFFLTFCDIEAIVADGTTNPSTFYLASGSNPYRGHHDQLFRRAPFSSSPRRISYRSRSIPAPHRRRRMSRPTPAISTSVQIAGRRSPRPVSSISPRR